VQTGNKDVNRYNDPHYRQLNNSLLGTYYMLYISKFPFVPGGAVLCCTSKTYFLVWGRKRTSLRHSSFEAKYPDAKQEL